MESMYPQIIDTRSLSAYPLSGRIVTIGSSADCHIRIKGRKTGARAAHLIFDAGGYKIQSLSGDTPVRINGAALDARGCRLVHGDEIEIGEAVFAYHEHLDGLEKSSAPAPGPVQELIQIVVSLLKNRDEEVFDSLVASVSRLLRCDAARLVMHDADTGERTTIAQFPRSAGIERFSARAIDWAHEASRTVLMHSDDWRGSEEPMNSLERNLVASVLCAPLKEDNAMIGYLYLDRLQAGTPFTEEDRAFCDTLIPLFSTILANFEQRRRQRDTIARLQNANRGDSGGMIYGSEIMAGVMAQAGKLAGADAPVLILGATGTGKELMARYIHNRSARSRMPFTAINCGAIPETLMESELFGHEKGAFTGAAQRKIGLFESAEGGTVLLDEVGELPLVLQVKLLRVLQEQEIVRVGGTTTIPVNVRILAATNRDLEKEVAEGRFRQDLYFRLNVLGVTLPPLRERGQDVWLLAEYFLKKYCDQFGLALKSFSADARAALLGHPWPGNIRELDNIVQKAALMSSTQKIGVADIQISTAHGMSADACGAITLRDARAGAERKSIEQTLARCGGNVSQAAKILEIDRKWLMKKMEEFGIAADTFRK